ncbi:MAG: hypothetical protein EHM61_22825 [Acidobacteria bacterium]|nr:MAG: hypothetical protein EHM61_22825 [Acidobacteriota bacterium]
MSVFLIALHHGGILPLRQLLGGKASRIAHDDQTQAPRHSQASRRLAPVSSSLLTVRVVRGIEERQAEKALEANRSKGVVGRQLAEDSVLPWPLLDGHEVNSFL